MVYKTMNVAIFSMPEFKVMHVDISYYFLDVITYIWPNQKPGWHIILMKEYVNHYCDRGMDN